MTHECVTHHHACDCREAEHSFQIDQRDKEIARLNHQHANDEAANRMLSDACARQSELIEALQQDREKEVQHSTPRMRIDSNVVDVSLNYQHRNDTAACALLEDAVARTRERAIKECAALFSGGMRNRAVYINNAEEMILALLEK